MNNDISNTPSSKDDLSFLKQLKELVTVNFKNLPKFLISNGIWLGSLAVIWLLLGSDIIKTYTLPNFLQSIIGFLIFITATYNGFVGKAILALFITSLLIPFINELRKGNALPFINERIDRIKKTFGIISNAFKEKGINAYILLLGYSGIGLIFANFISRNNKIDKYLACFLAGFGLINSLSQGYDNPPIKLIRAFWNDVNKLFNKKGASLSVSTFYIGCSAVALGLVGSVIFAFVNFTNSFYDPSAYIVGGIFIVGSVILQITMGNKNATK